MTAELIALLETDPAAGILAAAELRERRATLINEDGPGIWYVGDDHTINGPDYLIATVEDIYDGTLTEHIAAEANPAHVLAEVALWRAIVRGHDHGRYVCEDIAAVRDAVIAYLGEKS